MLTIPSHHAVCFVTSDRDFFVTSVIDSLNKDKKYFELISQNMIDIDTARKIKDWNNRSYGAPKTMILSFHTMNVYTQNALLKVLEEPQKDTQFILVTTHEHGLLATVRSRLSLYRDETQETSFKKEVELFLKTQQDARMELEVVTKLLDARDGEDRKDREKIHSFIATLFKVCAQEKIEPIFLKELAQVSLYAADPSSSGKILLEYIALRVPRVVV